MANLPLANILHHKLRSALSALGIACGVCMLVLLSGLARGTLGEVADRWEAVQADLIVYPLAESLADLSGIGLSDTYTDRVAREHPDQVRRVVPVFLRPMRIGGQDHLAAGVDARDLPVLCGGRGPTRGRVFDPEGKFSRWIEGVLLNGEDPNAPVRPDQLAPGEHTGGNADTGGSPGETGAASGLPPVYSPGVNPVPLELDTQTAFADPNHSGLELVIDDRLARKAKLDVGDTVQAANHHWRIVGIVPAGGMTRVYLPRRCAQFLFGDGSITRSTLLFVQLQPGAAPDQVARTLRDELGQEVVRLGQYRRVLQQKFGVMFLFVDAVLTITMAIAFLFIMNTLYTMVLQRTREIAILKSCGASRAFLLRQVLDESLLLTATGSAVGVATALIGGWAVTRWTLYTVSITWTWVLIALGVAAAGAVLAAVYPAWQASRVDVVEALSLE